jgi:hypothetical protein
MLTEETYRVKCRRLEEKIEQLIKERDAARMQVDSLRDGRTTDRNQKFVAAQSNSSASARVANTPRPAPALTSGLPVIYHTLAKCEAALQSCLAHSGPTVDFEQASEEEQRKMRDIRGLAASMTMLGILIMEKYHGALKPAMLRRVHASTWRPTQAGVIDGAADSVAPAISRVYFHSNLLRVVLPLVWMIGAACGLAVAFDCFENHSTPESAACTVAALMLPLNVCNGASLNAKTFRRLLREFQSLYVVLNVLGYTCLLLFLFRDHPAKMVVSVCFFPSILLAGFQDAYVEGGRVLNARIFYTLNTATYLLCMRWYRSSSAPSRTTRSSSARLDSSPRQCSAASARRCSCLRSRIYS